MAKFEPLQVSNVALNDDGHFVAQRFFLERTLWLRVVDLAGNKTVGWWSMSDPVNRESWEDLLRKLAWQLKSIDRRQEVVGPSLSFFPKGWDVWRLGTPAQIQDAGVLRELKAALRVPATYVVGVELDQSRR